MPECFVFNIGPKKAVSIEPSVYGYTVIGDYISADDHKRYIILRPPSKVGKLFVIPRKDATNG